MFSIALFFRPSSPQILFTSIRSGLKNLIGAFSLRHALDLSSYLKRNIDPGDHQRTIRHTGYIEPERAFLARSKEGRWHNPLREVSSCGF